MEYLKEHKTDHDRERHSKKPRVQTDSNNLPNPVLRTFGPALTSQFSRFGSGLPRNAFEIVVVFHHFSLFGRPLAQAQQIICTSAARADKAILVLGKHFSN